MPSNSLDEIATTLDDIAITLEEMKENCTANPSEIDRMRRSIEKAAEAIDRIENRGSGAKEIA